MGRDGNGEGGRIETWVILLPLFQALADYVLRFYFIQVIFQQFSTIRGRVLGGGLVGSQLLADIITGKLLILMLFNHMYSVKLFSMPPNWERLVWRVISNEGATTRKRLSV